MCYFGPCVYVSKCVWFAFTWDGHICTGHRNMPITIPLKIHHHADKRRSLRTNIWGLLGGLYLVGLVILYLWFLASSVWTPLCTCHYLDKIWAQRNYVDWDTQKRFQRGNNPNVGQIIPHFGGITGIHYSVMRETHERNYRGHCQHL